MLCIHRSVIATLATALVSLTSASHAATIPGLFPTGVDAGGASLPGGSPEVNYVLDSVPLGEDPTTLQVLPSIPNRFVTPTGNAAWIGVENGGADVSVGTYVYELSFDLTGFDPGTASIELSFAADNEVSIELNGTSTGLAATGDTAIESLTQGSITSGFVAGLNTLSFLVENTPLPNTTSPVNASGLLVDQISGSAEQVSNVPLPVPGPLLLAGLAGLAFLRRQRP